MMDTTMTLGSKPWILVVDDERGVAGYMTDILRGAGLEAFSVSNPKAALSIARQYRPRLILTDVEMPGLSGVEFTTALKSHQETQDIPVVFVSGNTAEEDHALGKFVGGDAYLDKPFTAWELLTTVRSCVAG